MQCGMALGFRKGDEALSFGFANCFDYNGRTHPAGRKESDMLWTVFVILLIPWLLGLMTSHTMGGFIHILLVIAIVVVLVRVIRGRKPL